ncbi:MAG: site-2 protease family protein [Acidobacteria bacterium]|nr:site-2 protease family protein [Acidobacteriota bacterium]
MPDILVVILAVIFVLGVAINIHEFGHFIVAKLLGMRIEAYSFFGLGPRIWGFKRGHTDYRISAIPLGAYVKLYGDEATASLEGGESEGEKVPDEELYELRPRWQKFLVMLGGPFMNIILALAIPFAAAMMYGVPSMPAPVVGIVSPGGAAETAGVKVGDRITSFNNVPDPTWESIKDESMISPEIEMPMVVDRGGQQLSLTIAPKKAEIDGNAIGDIGLTPDIGVEPVEVGQIQPDSPASASGLEVGDRVLALNGQTVRNSQELTNQIRENKDAPAKLTVERNGQRHEIEMVAKQGEDGIYRVGIGFSAAAITARVPVGLGGAAAFAYESNMRILRLTGRVFGQMFAGERSVKDAGLAGPVGIVQIIAKVVREAGFAGLFGILAVISLNLGVFNLLPIPLLDGGQIVMLGVDKVLSWFGKTLSIAVREKIQVTGLAIILLLMVFVMYLDISRLF